MDGSAAQVGVLGVIAGRRAQVRALDTAMDELDARLHRIGQHPFRAKFRLRGRDRAVVDLRGIAVVRRHAEELIERRLAPARPRNDGRQTPYRGHPVFVAQHATATCCRTCLARARRRRAPLRRGGDLPVDRTAVRPPPPAAVTGSRRHPGLTDPGGGTSQGTVPRV